MTKWYVDSLIGMTFFAINLLIAKRVSVLGVPPLILVGFMFTVASSLFVSHIFVSQQPLNLDSKKIYLLLLTGLFCYLGNLFYFRAFGKSPNPGYAMSVNSLNVALVAVFSVFLFGSHLSFQKITGIILSLIGVWLVVI